MPTSNRLVFPRSLTSDSVTSRTAVYGPVRTVVWQGSVGDRRPYADLVGKGLQILPTDANRTSGSISGLRFDSEVTGVFVNPGGSILHCGAQFRTSLLLARNSQTRRTRSTYCTMTAILQKQR